MKRRSPQELQILVQELKDKQNKSAQKQRETDSEQNLIHEEEEE